MSDAPAPHIYPLEDCTAAANRHGRAQTANRSSERNRRDRLRAMYFGVRGQRRAACSYTRTRLIWKFCIGVLCVYRYCRRGIRLRSFALHETMSELRLYYAPKYAAGSAAIHDACHSRTGFASPRACCGAWPMRARMGTAACLSAGAVKCERE